MDIVIGTIDPIYVTVTKSNGKKRILPVLDGQTLYTKKVDAQYSNIGEAFAEQANGYAFRNLPTAGQIVHEGICYLYNGQVVYCRQTHIRTSHEPNEVPAIFYYKRENPEGMEWIPQEYVSLNNTRTFNGVLYKCIQAHVTLEGYTPNITPALWIVVAQGTNWTAGIQVTIGQEYVYQGVTYRVLQSHTTQVGWEPPKVPALWAKV